MKKGLIEKLPWILFIIEFIVFIVFVITKIDMMLDSDMSSELILSKLVANEHGFLSKNWYYSTELRVLNTQLIFGFFFLFTDSFKFVRMAGTITLMIILLLSWFYLCSMMGGKKYFPVTALFILCPISSMYAEIVSFGTYYIPHIAISFTTFGLLLQITQLMNQHNGTSVLKVRKTYILFALLVILSILAGMGGPRQLLVLYIPLALTIIYQVILKKNINNLWMIVSPFASLIGFWINKSVLSKNYTYDEWAVMEYKPFRFQALENVVQGVLNCFGFSYGDVFSFTTVRNGLMGLMVLMIILYLIRSYSLNNNAISSDKNNAVNATVSNTNFNSSMEDEIFETFFVMASLVFTALYIFTDMSYESRYWIPILAMALPFSIKALKRNESDNWNKLVLTCFLIFVPVVAGAVIYKDLDNRYIASDLNHTKDLEDIVEVAEKADILTGYASYWNANVLTEISDGNIDMYSWPTKLDELVDVNELFDWLQVKDHFNTVPEGPVFIMFNRSELESAPLAKLLSTLTNPAYSNDNYTAYAFASYDAMISTLSSMNVPFNQTEYLNNAYLEDNSWIYLPGGSSRGPYITLYPGSYTISVAGENISKLSFTSEYGFGEGYLENNNFVDNGEITFTVSPDKTVKLYSLIIQNNSEENVRINRITIRRM